MNLDAYARFLIDLIGWTLVAAVAYLLLFRGLRSLSGRTRTEADNIVLRTIRLPLIVAIIAYGMVSALRELDLPPIVAGFIRDTYVVILIAAGTFLAWRILKEVIIRWLAFRSSETEGRLDDLIVPLISTVGPLVFFIVGAVSILQYLGVNVALLAAGVGITGLIVGLAFQDALTNLFSGIYLMVDPSFLENDLIRLEDGKVFSVERVGLRTTRLYDMDTHAQIFVPNNSLITGKITNITKPTIEMKAKMNVTVPASTKPAQATQILHEVMASHRNVLGQPRAKMLVLSKRIADLCGYEGERGATLAAAVTALEEWQASDAGTEQAQTQLMQVRRDINDCLAAAQEAIKHIPSMRAPREDVDRLRNALGAEGKTAEVEEIDQARIARINRAYQVFKTHLSADEAGTLDSVIARLTDLDRTEFELEHSIDHAEQAREADLDRLLATLVWSGDRVAEDMAAQGRTNQAARISLWVRNMAVLYAEVEVQESVDGLDKELDSLIHWLGEMEAGGITKAERARIRALFGGWGGLRQLERRRVNELRRRIYRWLEWKEKDVVSPDEYDRLRNSWERRLRILGRKLPDTGPDDEESLDTQLVQTRAWLHSINFMEQTEDWKLPAVVLLSYDSNKMDYRLTYYIDDIKMQHFNRQNYVLSALLMDLFETSERQGLEQPEAREA
jgi:MscS family membrane protein